MKLIDADKLFEYIQKEKAWKQDTILKHQYEKGKRDAYYEVLKIIEEQTTLSNEYIQEIEQLKANQPVRCGECIYSDHDFEGYFCVKDLSYTDLRADDYCSFGKREGE